MYHVIVAKYQTTDQYNALNDTYLGLLLFILMLIVYLYLNKSSMYYFLNIKLFFSGNQFINLLHANHDIAPVVNNSTYRYRTMYMI